MQRELSAVRLTEGLFDRSSNKLTDSMEISVNVIIGDANDLQAIIFQKFGSPGILLNVTILVVLRAIQFDHQFCFCTVKINDVFADYSLAQKSNRIGTKIIIPQVPFFFCHLFSQLLCQWN